MPVFPLLLTYVALDPVCNAPWLNYGFMQSPMRRQHESAELRPTLFAQSRTFTQYLTKHHVAWLIPTNTDKRVRSRTT